MPKSPRRCIFCNSGGVTNEHLFSRWIHKIVPPIPEATNRLARLRASDIGEAGTKVRLRATLKQGDVIHRKARVVCGSCNNGWMNKLEEAARPYLTPLILGQTLMIEPAAQCVISEWIALKAMVMSFDTVTLSSPIPEEACHSFKETLTLGSGWDIWIGYYAGAALRAHYASRTLYESVNLPGEPVTIPTVNDRNTYVLVLVIGKLFIHAGWSALNLFPQHTHNQLAPSLLPLWPLRDRPIGWPAITGLTDEQAVEIFNLFMHPNLREWAGPFS
jgi:hypothetical protein